MSKLGKSNDVIPNDEMQLAMLVQNAKSYGLKHYVGKFYDSSQHIDDEYEEGKTTACCAIGAAYLSDDTHGFIISTEGNDASHYPSDDNPDFRWYVDYDGRFHPNYMLGAGFRCAMQD
jgi:hypothetical protein